MKNNICDRCGLSNYPTSVKYAVNELRSTSDHCYGIDVIVFNDFYLYNKKPSANIYDVLIVKYNAELKSERFETIMSIPLNIFRGMDYCFLKQKIKNMMLFA